MIQTETPKTKVKTDGRTIQVPEEVHQWQQCARWKAKLPDLYLGRFARRRKGRGKLRHRAAVTVIPLRYGSGNEVGTETTFRTASGDAIRYAGRCILSGKLRTGTRAELRGRLAPVHRVLASETEVCKNQYAVLDQNGGICRILIPRRNGERIR